MLLYFSFIKVCVPFVYFGIYYSESSYISVYLLHFSCISQYTSCTPLYISVYLLHTFVYLSIPLAHLCISQYTSGIPLYFRSRVRWSTITSSVWTVLECPFGTLVERWHHCTQHPSIHGNHICQAIVLHMTWWSNIRCSGESPSLTPPQIHPAIHIRGVGRREQLQTKETPVSERGLP